MAESGQRRAGWTTWMLAGGLVVVAALIGFALYVATGIETEVRAEDRRALMTVEKVKGHFSPQPVWVMEREVVQKQQLRALSCELEYTYDDVSGSGVLIDHLIVRDGDAGAVYAGLERGLSALEAQGLREEVLEGDARWGEAGRFSLLRRGEQAAAWRFVGWKGEWVVQLVIGGGGLERDAFAAIVADALSRLDRAPPCRW